MAGAVCRRLRATGVVHGSRPGCERVLIHAQRLAATPIHYAQDLTWPTMTGMLRYQVYFSRIRQQALEECYMKRRQFIAGGAAGTAAAASTVYSPLTIAKNKKFKLGMVTSWPTSLDTLFGTAKYIGKALETATQGDVSVEVFPAGAQVRGLEVFDAVSSGAFALGHTASYYYIGKDPTHAFFTTQPFGLTSAEQNAWLISGDGEDLWNEVNAKSNMVAYAAGQTGAQTGGWFNKEINSPGDLKGLKMRFPGVGGQVMSRAGVVIQNLPGGEIYFALERGVIDAADWVSPTDDEKLGLNKAAKYYYTPSWAEPGPTVGLYVNKDILTGLPKDIRDVIPIVAHAANER